MNGTAFRSSLIAFLVGAVLAFFLIVILNQIYLNFQTPIRQIIFVMSPFAGGLVTWWVNYMVSNRKVELDEIQKKIDTKVSRQEFEDHLKTETDFRRQMMDMWDKMDTKLDDLKNLLINK